MNPIDKIWTEKYRPKKVVEVIGESKEKVLKYMDNPETIPSFIFHSTSPGTGKTSLMKAIVNDLGCDSIIINSSDDRKIEVIRDKVKEFAKTKSSNSVRKCILMDEADGMLSASQNALRNMMETYSNNVFFIISCNNINKIIDPIQSRCKIIHFAYPPKEDIEKYLTTICEKEGLQFTPDGIKELINKKYPSIRDCVVALQDLKTDEKTVIPENINADNPLFEEMWQHYKDKNWQAIKEVVMATTIDPRELNTFFWMQGVKNNNIKMIQITCMNERSMATGADPKIVMVTSLIDMVK